MSLYPSPLKPSRLKRAIAFWLELPQFVRPGLLIVVLVVAGLMVGCALQDFRPYGALDLKDENTRLAEPHWIDWGTLWVGFKATFFN